MRRLISSVSLSTANEYHMWCRVPEDNDYENIWLRAEPHRFDDPLQSALDRGSNALNFTNSPLVLDYMHMKFSRSIPSWRARVPFHHNIHEEYYKYDDIFYGDNEGSVRRRERPGYIKWDGMSNRLLRYHRA